MKYETFTKLESEIIRFGIFMYGLPINNRKIIFGLIHLVYPFYSPKEDDVLSERFMMVDYNLSDDSLSFQYYNDDGKIIEEEYVPSILSLIRKEKIKRAFS